MCNKDRIDEVGLLEDSPSGEEDTDSHARTEPSFYTLLRENREFRLYISSFLVTTCGEWLTYVAAIAMIEEWLGGDDATSSRTAISYLVVIRLMPNVILSAVGGLLADSRDRRQSMIALDTVGALVTLLNLVAFYYKSIPFIYLVTMLQQCVAALYEPCRGAILPLIVTDEEALKKATTLSNLAWSLTTAIGASLGGVVVSYFGCRVCFVLDSLTYLISAYIMYLLRGEWSAVDKGAREYTSLWDKMVGMTIEGYKYVCTNFWGPLVLLKASAALVYGATDVLYVSFAERGTGDASLKLGFLFAMTGVGCIAGPLVSDRFTSTSDMKSLQLASIWSIAIVSLGCLGMGIFSPFLYTCIFSLVRSAGSSAAWTNSSVLLQSFSAPEKMGRVLAVDYTVCIGPLDRSFLCTPVWCLARSCRLVGGAGFARHGRYGRRCLGDMEFLPWHGLRRCSQGSG